VFHSFIHITYIAPHHKILQSAPKQVVTKERRLERFVELDGGRVILLTNVWQSYTSTRLSCSTSALTLFMLDSQICLFANRRETDDNSIT